MRNYPRGHRRRRGRLRSNRRGGLSRPMAGRRGAEGHWGGGRGGEGGCEAKGAADRGRNAGLRRGFEAAAASPPFRIPCNPPVTVRSNTQRFPPAPTYPNTYSHTIHRRHSALYEATAVRERRGGEGWREGRVSLRTAKVREIRLRKRNRGRAGRFGSGWGLEGGRGGWARDGPERLDGLVADADGAPLAPVGRRRVRPPLVGEVVEQRVPHLPRW